MKKACSAVARAMGSTLRIVAFAGIAAVLLFLLCLVNVISGRSPLA